MQVIFYKWCQYLKMKDVTKFLSLYSTNCHIVSDIKNNHKNTVLVPNYHEPYQKTRIGILKTFEDILFSPHRSFDIDEINVEYCRKNNVIHGDCDFIYLGEKIKTRHTVFLTKEKNEDLISFHYTDFQKTK